MRIHVLSVISYLAIFAISRMLNAVERLGNDDIMGKYEKIASVWEDLNASYKMYEKKYSPSEFVEAILNKKSGEAGKRSIIKRLYDSAREEGVSQDAVETIVLKINAVVEKLKESSPDTRDIEGWLVSDRRVMLEDFSAIQNTTLITFNDLLRGGRLLPEIRLGSSDYDIVTEFCTDYRCVINNFVDAYLIISRLKQTGEDVDLLYAIASVCKEFKTSFPLVIISPMVTPTIKAGLADLGKKLTINKTNLGKELFSVKDDYGRVYFMEAAC